MSAHPAQKDATPAFAEARGRGVRPEAAQELGEWGAAYVRHLQTARKLADAHDQLVQPQKRADLRAALEAALARLVELRHHLARPRTAWQQCCAPPYYTTL